MSDEQPGFANEGVQDLTQQHQTLNELEIPEGIHLTYHMVPQAHLDLSWFWPLSDTLEMGLSLFREAVEILKVGIAER